jgi:transposase-like protein
LILDVLRGQATVADVCTRLGLTVEEFEAWRRRLMDAAEAALEPGESGQPWRASRRDLHEKIGAQAMDIERLRKRVESLANRPQGLVG